MPTLKYYEDQARIAKQKLDDAKLSLYNYVRLPIHYQYESLDKVDTSTLNDLLLTEAFEDCEGSYNCGLPEYRQQIYVAGELYEAVLRVEYGRHDKTYYFIDESEFSIEKVTDDAV